MSDTSEQTEDQQSPPRARRTPRTSPAKGAPIPRGKHKANRRRSAWIELPILVLVAVVVAILVRTFVLETFYIPSGSMKNTLLIGDRVLVNKVSYKFRDPHRGEIVVFKPPADWKQGTQDADDFIKRIIGVGGDHVVCCDTKGRVTVNGHALNEGFYLHPGNSPSQIRFDVTVPKNRYFVMGDHRAESADSRYHLNDHLGTIPRKSLVGRAFALYWPLNRIDILPVPKAFKQVPSAGSG